MRALIVLLSATVALCAAQAADLPPRIGDAASVFDPAKFDERHPEMREWAKAGVAGGIPPRADSPVVARLKPGDDVQAAIDAARSADERAVVLLAAGTYRFDDASARGEGKRVQPCYLALRPGVILRGEDRDGVVLEFHTEEQARTGDGFAAPPTVQLADRSGLEDLTVRNATVAAQDYAKVKNKFKNPDGTGGLPAIFAQGVSLAGCSDAWVQRCRILDSGTGPGHLHDAVRCTMRDNLVERSWSKGGSGNGYYHVTGGSHNLLYNETVRDIRHFCIQGPRHTVVINCRFEVDYNFHNLPSRDNLLEASVVAPAPGHQWGHRDGGFARYLNSPADNNLIWRVEPAFADGKVYRCAQWKGRAYPQRLIVPAEREPPRAGTFYPVTGVHREPTAAELRGK